MQRMLAPFWLGAFAASLLSATALAEDRYERFDRLDLDGNGRLTTLEVEQHHDIRKHWDQVDLDASGDIDLIEFSAFEAQMEESGEEPITGAKEPKARAD
ncbi:hypothetical protein [Motiliproteus sp. SC1-56]|uniref:hypothetical protein n=1 Tax=Motiliproteus sp. SC1-56 TaxID=2799565 RepID=UPI001A8EDBED|nr:hypothetical protein [Motiliproteus sp. SC1-56]